MAALISPALLADLQALDEAAMPSVCAITRAATSNVGGRTIAGPVTTVATVPCRVAPLGTSPREGVQAGRMDAESDGQVSFPLGTDVQDGDQIEATTAGVTTAFEVVGPVIQGSYSNVVGLPVDEVRAALIEMGIIRDHAQ